MCHKIWCDRKSWKVFGFLGELNKALIVSQQLLLYKDKIYIPS